MKNGRISSIWQKERKKIVANFSFNSFKEAVVFVNKVAVLAEKENHHPGIKLNYNKVTLILFTHSVNDLTEKDFILASKIDALN